MESTSTITVGAGSDPIISNLSTTQFEVCGNKTIQLTGSNFNPDSGSTKVYIDTDDCKVISMDTTSISCVAPEGRPGSKKLSVVRLDGYSSLPYKITYVLEVDSVSPSRGSYAGGLLLTIQGKGFCVDTSIVDVKIGPFECEVTEVNNNFIKCRQPTSTKTVKIDNNGRDASKFEKPSSYR